VAVSGALTGMEQAILAVYGCAASIAWLCLGLPGIPVDFTLPWAVIPLPAFAAAFWLASRYRPRLLERAGWRARLAAGICLLISQSCGGAG
jgi:hypothetical protein